MRIVSVLISVISLLLIIGALVDIISRPDDEVKHLPKLVWVILVVFLPLIGSVVWFAVGREYAPRVPRQRTARSTAPVFEPLPARKSTEEQIAELDREIEYYQKRARLKELQEGSTPLAIEGAKAETDAPMLEPLPERGAINPET